jgi:hypothetical protein
MPQNEIKRPTITLASATLKIVLVFSAIALGKR